LILQVQNEGMHKLTAAQQPVDQKNPGKLDFQRFQKRPDRESRRCLFLHAEKFGNRVFKNMMQDI